MAATKLIVAGDRDTTIASYDRHARTYRDRTDAISDVTRQARRDFVGRLSPGARVLEIGSGAGQDALAFEADGLSMRRTDVTPGFVELLRAGGHRAELLDPLIDDLRDPDSADGRHDGIWASGCLHHVDRDDLPTVLTRLGEVTRPGGVLCLSVKAGEGEQWISEGTIDAPRRFVYWTAEGLRTSLESAGWQVDGTDRNGTGRGRAWVRMWASRPQA